MCNFKKEIASSVPIRTTRNHFYCSSILCAIRTTPPNLPATATLSQNLEPVVHRLQRSRSGLMVSVLTSGLSSPGSSPEQEDNVFLGKTRVPEPLSTQEYKRVPCKWLRKLNKLWGVTCDGLAFCPGGVEILLVAYHTTESRINFTSYKPVAYKASLCKGCHCKEYRVVLSKDTK